VFGGDGADQVVRDETAHQLLQRRLAEKAGVEQAAKATALKQMAGLRSAEGVFEPVRPAPSRKDQWGSEGAGADASDDLKLWLLSAPRPGLKQARAIGAVRAAAGYRQNIEVSLRVWPDRGSKVRRVLKLVLGIADMKPGGEALAWSAAVKEALGRVTQAPSRRGRNSRIAAERTRLTLLSSRSRHNDFRFMRLDLMALMKESCGSARPPQYAMA